MRLGSIHRDYSEIKEVKVYFSNNVQGGYSGETFNQLILTIRFLWSLKSGMPNVSRKKFLHV